MKIITASGTVTIDKDSPFGRWIQGWTDGGGWTGSNTIRVAWDLCKKTMSGSKSVQWYRLGKLQAVTSRYVGE